jgi:hypothetical protein
MAEVFQGAAQDPPPFRATIRKHPAPTRQPASQTDVIDAHNMAIIAQPMENARQDPNRTTLSASRGDSTGVLTVLWRIFPPYSAKPNPSIDFP